MTSITRHKFMGELAKLLSGMTEWDREAVTAKYNALFDADPNEEEVSAKLGSPTMAAVRELRGYVPTPDPREAEEQAAAEQSEDAEAPESAAAQPEAPEAETAPEAEAAEPDADVQAETPAEAPQEPEIVSPEDFPDIEALLDSDGSEPDKQVSENDESAPQPPIADAAKAESESAPAKSEKHAPELVELPDIDLAAETAPEDVPAPSAPKLRAGRLILYILFGIVVCLPVTAVLAVLALAILALGVGVGAAGIFAVTLAFHGITVFADVMLLCGAGVAVAALGIPIAFFAFWFFVKCVVGFVDGVLRMGKKWCSETPEKEDEDE